MVVPQNIHTPTLDGILEFRKGEREREREGWGSGFLLIKSLYIANVTLTLPLSLHNRWSIEIFKETKCIIYSLQNNCPLLKLPNCILKLVIFCFFFLVTGPLSESQISFVTVETLKASTSAQCPLSLFCFVNNVYRKCTAI